MNRFTTVAIMGLAAVALTAILAQPLSAQWGGGGWGGSSGGGTSGGTGGGMTGKGTPTGGSSGGSTGSTNSAPVANAGSAQAVVFGAAVQLNGSGSYDPDGDPITYEWTQISGTAVVLSDATNVAPTFTAPEVESDLTFRLVVTDSNGASGAMNVLVYVNADGTFPPFDAGSNSSSGGGGGCVAAQGGGAAVLVFGLIAAAARRRRKQ